MSQTNIINPNIVMRIIMLIAMITICYTIYEEINFISKQRNQLTRTYLYIEKLNSESNTEIREINYVKRRIYLLNRMKIMSKIKQINLKQTVHNTDILGPVNNSTRIIVIQVHSNLFILKQLLESLNAADSISNTLLIFSHDVFNIDIHRFIHNVRFARYMQIFYPFSIQLYLNKYPGKERTCNGQVCKQSKIPRNPIAAQKKLHWWWQLNQVFDHLAITRSNAKSILFLEDDNYVAVDFLRIMRSLENDPAKLPGQRIISLGSRAPDVSLYTSNTSVSFNLWADKITDIGIGFDRGVWKYIKSFSFYYCYYNDYSWYNTLRYIGSRHKNASLYYSTVDSPRVFRIKLCDKNNNNCDLDHKLEKVKKMVQVLNKTVNSSIHQDKILNIVGDISVKPLGHFSDERDHAMCMYFSRNCFWY